jgi:hypothetical protein
VNKLSLRARAALYYFANSDMTISADRLAEEVLEGRKAILPALRELRAAGYIVTRKERVNNGVVTVSYVTEKGFLEANSWGVKSHSWSPQKALQIQQSEQNSIIQVLTNSDININKTTIDERLGEEMGYEFFENTASDEAANEREAQRIKASKERKAVYQEQKEVEHSKRLLERDNRKLEDWTVNQSALEFEKRINEIWGIKPWKLSGSKFYIAFASARKKYDTNGVLELEMMNLFFTQLKLNKESDGEKLWKLFIVRFSELSNQARLQIVSPELMERAMASAEEQWKKEFGEDFSV